MFGQAVTCGHISATLVRFEEGMSERRIGRGGEEGGSGVKV